ncbi:hypothetical protein GPECTOR_17g941 [Gonium pectorale]|uniref:Pseudouridine-5'-phosphate glycosidase n=1 Tax=Gonium pectorale TaxID=33097 RepID=A0A150GKH1_GONPE|nr:hypothetical protein GPECTOR_17g941 [Gonium pectorale]|eukprot:KXZ50302.1 hypothetical protein GPECTOR_17g941 [Gonium pectorale]
MADARLIRVSPEVQAALAEGRPVVALESTIISHGMPWPDNLATALEVEGVVRDSGATPATIAIIEGVPHIGMQRAQLEHIARRGTAVQKVSRRDLPVVIAKRLDGATTVSATAALAALAGIQVFVTGGIGGVHRGGEATMDVSADLTELGRTPVAVVCAGAKSILDIPRTLEVLETLGVPVAAYGTDEFPAFFTPRSGCQAPARVDSPKEAAALLDAGRRLGLGGGMLLAVPIPADAAAEGAEVEAAISTALREAEERGVKGNQLTPFLLERVRTLTGGRSLAANIRLVKNNAAVGSALATELATLQRAAQARGQSQVLAGRERSRL